MKVKKEEIQPDTNSSFRILLTPQLQTVFLWHYHPEYELVYITGASGNRHVGDHISCYEGSDLVFIGPNIPHLNFDYGVKTDHRKVVVQMKADFMGEQFLQIPEFAAIARLFKLACNGVSFFGETKRIVGEQLERLAELPSFERLMTLIAVFQRLAISDEMTLLNEKPVENQYTLKEQQRLSYIHRYIDENFQRKIELTEMAALVNLTEAAFCRYFKKMTRLTFTQFLNQYRINQAQKLLLVGHNVTETCFASGFESVSYFNKTFKKVTGENPMQFKKRHRSL
ncbi:AraC family transcriptional regulator [Spirosoma agri]|uniref:Helix-turn-helix transcriptional regulator n=1 Tax=Spirosoma agri TaxID=1987381 RepID=A0A6M0IG37_9BACT|nr:AraC family transcriptional regulator [Spirosoma agri]NEU67250.1 helix-turn-helix transcriptional regulator [Spirosoma agri]